jgi:hypothetical protein
MSSPHRIALRLAPLLLLACSALNGPYLAPEPTLPPAPMASLTPVAPSPTAPANLTATPEFTATPAPTAVPSAVPHDVSLAPTDVLVHPDPDLYSGDVVSFEILAHNPSGDELGGLPVTVYLDELGGEVLASGTYAYSGFASRDQATFYWAWDTAGLTGKHTIVVAQDTANQLLATDPDLANNVTAVTMELLPPEARPAPESEAQWATAQNACCVFHYLTGTAAERDIEALMGTAEGEVEIVEDFLGVSRGGKLDFTLLSRLVGHGGFASDSISISYLDRDYAGGDVPQVFKHEAVHILDRRLSRSRPVIMTEGLAVYVSGGHFKVEDLEARAVALLALNRYIPLAELADSFYPSQHEIGYMEAAAFVRYMVETYGWEAFRTFYGTFREGGPDSEVLDAALRLNFDKSMAEMEADWLAYLGAQTPDPEQMADVRDTVAFYDTVRRYQQAADPFAHYLTAWLPDTGQMRQRGLVADYLRHPAEPANLALEAMLADGAAAIRSGDYDRAEWLIASANAVLGAGAFDERAAPGEAAFADPLAAQYLQVVLSTLDAGYEPQRITLTGTTAQVTGIRDWPHAEDLTFSLAGGAWVLNTD